MNVEHVDNLLIAERYEAPSNASLGFGPSWPKRGAIGAPKQGRKLGKRPELRVFGT